MKQFLLFIFLICLSGISFSQTSFLVLNPDGQPTGGVDVLRNDKLMGKTGPNGRFIIPKLGDGETLVFKLGDLTTTYVINNGAASGMDQKIRLGSPTQVSEDPRDFWDDHTAVPVEPAPKPHSENEINSSVEEQAEFPGGNAAMMAFIQKNIRYPEKALKEELGGKCFIKFVVEKDGKITDIQIVRGITDCPECNMEAIRVVKMMPNWKPGKIKGNAVRSYYHLPIVFNPNK